MFQMISLVFQSTPPSRGVTIIFPRHSILHKISIHTPLAGSDSNYSQKTFLIFGTIDKYLFLLFLKRLLSKQYTHNFSYDRQKYSVFPVRTYQANNVCFPFAPYMHRSQIKTKYTTASYGVVDLRSASVGAEHAPLAHSPLTAFAKYPCPKGLASHRSTTLGSLPAGINQNRFFTPISTETGDSRPNPHANIWTATEPVHEAPVPSRFFHSDRDGSAALFYAPARLSEISFCPYR